MSSIAFFASPIDESDTILNKRNDNNQNNSNNIISKKRNKTQKNFSKDIYYSEKVSNMINAIHNNPEGDYNELENYSPLSPPQSAGVQKTIDNEKNTKKIENYTSYYDNEENNENDISMNNYEYINPTNKYNDDGANINNNPQNYYNKIIPPSNYNSPLLNDNPYESQEQQYYYNINNTNESENGNKNILLEKLNYMIHLLEEKQDEKTGNIMEEVVLYSFLGIFIIFIVDSFVRVGKYVR